MNMSPLALSYSRTIIRPKLPREPFQVASPNNLGKTFLNILLQVHFVKHLLKFLLLTFQYLLLG